MFLVVCACGPPTSLLTMSWHCAGAAAVQQPSSLLTGADAEATVAQAKALLKQRSTLLASPEYDKNSEVVKQIDRQVQELGNMALGAWSTKEQSA